MKKYLTSKKIATIKSHINQNNSNTIYASFILAENAKNSKNFSDELNNLFRGHKDYLKTKQKAASQEFNYFTNL